jgi:hypothetical protein
MDAAMASEEIVARVRDAFIQEDFAFWEKASESSKEKAVGSMK